MRKKHPPLDKQEKLNRFKEAISSLDPALALNNEFITNIKEFQKRYNSKTYHFKFTPDIYKRIEGRVNTTGTRVSLDLASAGIIEKIIWHKYNQVKNAPAIEGYAKFKERARTGREEAEANQKLRDQKKAILVSLKGLIPHNAPIEIDGGWNAEDEFSINIKKMPQAKVAMIIQKIAELI